ncbi:hypothetical protein ACFDTO_24995 [Microbacteriaceae bacterium 4G12]
MKKRVLTFAIAGLLTAGGVGVMTTLAAGSDTSNTPSKSTEKETKAPQTEKKAPQTQTETKSPQTETKASQTKAKEAGKEDYHDGIVKVAEKLGIATEGKSTKDLIAEIRKEKEVRQPSIQSAKGETLDKKATEKKDKQFQEEINKMKGESLTEAAKRFGIATEGKSDVELRQEIQKARNGKLQEILGKKAEKIDIQAEGKSSN